MLEIVCIIWFTFEYLIRFVTSLNTYKFMIEFLSIVDLACILPFYFGILFGGNILYLKIKYELQMLRVLRLLKLGRYSVGIKSFAYALKSSSKALLYLVVLICFNVLLFSSFVYYAEQSDPETAFTSILAACW